MHFLSLQNQASCHLSLGHLSQAIGLLKTCLREGETTLRGDDRIRVRVLLAEAYLAALNIERATASLEDARRVAAELQMEELDDALRLDEGRLAVAGGRWADATRAFSDALNAAIRLGHPMVEPIARAQLSRASARIGEINEPPSLNDIHQKPQLALLIYLAADADAARRPSKDAGLRLDRAGALAGELQFLTLERAAFERAAEVWGALGEEEARSVALRRAAIAMSSLEANLPNDLREAFTAHPRNEALRALVPA